MNRSRTPFPAFLVAGTQKAGTTSLHAWLRQQPEVCLPTIKETHFFSNDENFARGFEWYVSRFSAVARDCLAGEVCPEYLFSPVAPARIRRWNARPRVAVLLRHPIERAFSHYRMIRRAGLEELVFPEALEAESDRLREGGEFDRVHFGYMARGRYARQIEHWRKELPGARLHFVKFDDLIDTGETGLRTYEQICRFIGVTSPASLADRRLRLNRASRPRSSAVADLLYKPSRLRRAIGRCIPGRDLRLRILLAIEQWNLRPIQEPEEICVPARFEVQSRQEIEKLARATGLDLNDWLSRSWQAPRRNVAA